MLRATLPFLFCFTGWVGWVQADTWGGYPELPFLLWTRGFWNGKGPCPWREGRALVKFRAGSGLTLCLAFGVEHGAPGRGREDASHSPPLASSSGLS